MAAGLPVICSKLPGVTTDFINSGEDGILVEKDDPQLYSQALQYILMNPDEGTMMGKSARNHAVSEFNLQTASDRYRILYQSLS